MNFDFQLLWEKFISRGITMNVFFFFSQDDDDDDVMPAPLPPPPHIDNTTQL